MKKKAIIVISLIKESEEKANQEIEKEIYEALKKEPALIPWLAKVEKVTITEA
jgi:Ribonuclease G/E